MGPKHSKRWKAAAPAVMLFMVACGPHRGGSAVPLERGVSQALSRHRASTLSNIAYRLELKIPRASTAPIEGLIEIGLEKEGSGSLVIDFNRPASDLKTVRLGGEDADHSFENGHIVLDAPQGPLQVAIEFRAGDNSLNRRSDFLYALFVPDRASTSIPCFDQPDLKAKVSLALEIPSDWEAVANGAETARSSSGDRIHIQFAQTRPISSYLMSFAAGRFSVVEGEAAGRPMRFLHREDDEASIQRNADEIFALHGRALEWLEDYTGIPYPFEKFDFVLIPSFQYGGMEHPGAIFYRQESLMLEKAATQSQELGRASVIAHETAHMWFGDLVTMKWFDDVWTKEVFANFMAAKIVHPSFPEIDHELRFLLSHYPAAYAVDRTEGANPIRQELDNLQEAGTLYGAIIYQKAPIVMRQLEKLVGEERLQEGLRTYLQRYSYANARWPDLIDILDAGSEVDLKAWSRVWVEESGRPHIRSSLEIDSSGKVASYRLTQSDPRHRGLLWPQDLTVVWADGESIQEIPLSLRQATADVRQVQGKLQPRYLIPSGAGVGYGFFRLDPTGLQALLTAFPNIENDLHRASAWLTLWDALQEGQLGPSSLTERLFEALEQEQTEQLVQRFLTDLSTLFWHWNRSAERQELASRLERLLWDRLNTAATTSLKAAFFRSYVDMALDSRSLNRLRRVWSKREVIPGLPLTEPDFTRLAQALALRQAQDWKEILKAQLERIENADRRRRFAFLIPSLSAHQAERDSFFENLAVLGNRRHEPWVLSGLGFLHHPLRAESSRKYIRPSLDLLQEIQRTGDIFFPKRWLDATFSGHNTPEAARLVEEFLAENPDYPVRLRAKILQSSDRLNRTAKLLRATP